MILLKVSLMLINQYYTVAQHPSMRQSHRLVPPIDPHQEQGLGDEQADAEVLMDGVAVTLEATEEAEGEEADEQADQRQEDADPSDDIEKHVVNGVRVLRERWWERVVIDTGLIHRQSKRQSSGNREKWP